MNTENTFYYNRGLVESDETSVRQPAIELFKVTHLDLDNAIKGIKSGSVFLKTTAYGFYYLETIEAVAEAYELGELYVVEGNW